MSWILWGKTHRARKGYECHVCGAPILRGQTYVRLCGKHEGIMVVARCHRDCLRVERAVNDRHARYTDDEWLTPDVWEPDDWRFLAEAMPHAARALVRARSAKTAKAMIDFYEQECCLITNCRIAAATEYAPEAKWKQECEVDGVDWEYVDQNGGGFSGDDFFGTTSVEVLPGWFFVFDYYEM